MRLELNLNDTVKVKLNEWGLEIYKSRYSHLKELSVEPRNKDRNGYSTFQLWSLMEIFGPHMHIGMETPFVDNELVLVSS